MMPTCGKKGCQNVSAYLSRGEVVRACFDHKRWFNRQVKKMEEQDAAN